MRPRTSVFWQPVKLMDTLQVPLFEELNPKFNESQKGRTYFNGKERKRGEGKITLLCPNGDLHEFNGKTRVTFPFAGPSDK